MSGDLLVLPCGCVIDTLGDAMVMQPCRQDCELYQYALAEAERQGKPVEYKEK